MSEKFQPAKVLSDEVQFSTEIVRVAVPATSANLGPGFDCFGLALTRYDQVSAQIIPDGMQVSFTGEGVDSLPRDERHLILRSMRATFDRLGGQPTGVRVVSENHIPHGRGLGSSAAAIVAGVQLARALVIGGVDLLSEAETLELASQLEGHPDNVAACLLGGLTIAWTPARSPTAGAEAIRIDPLGIYPAIFIPASQSSTVEARATLPSTVPHVDAAFNAARAALLPLALTSHPELLLEATEDRLHQQYRGPAMPESWQLVGRLRAVGLAAIVSGAGSSVLALLTSPAQLAVAAEFTPPGWEFAQHGISEGARVEFASMPS